MKRNPKKQLHVRVFGSALVPDYEAQEQGQRRFVGRHPQHPWPIVDAVITIPARSEYIQHVRDGELIPWDAETAKLCGVFYAELNS